MKPNMLFVLASVFLLLSSCGKSEKQDVVPKPTESAQEVKIDEALQSRVNEYFNIYKTAISNGKMDEEALKSVIEPSKRENEDAQRYYSSVGTAVQSNITSNTKLDFKITGVNMIAEKDEAIVYYKVIWKNADGSVSSDMDTELKWRKVSDEWYIVVEGY
ncbi:hypothetical protein JXI42_05425 [bacterium]|nr:hypothetical protein [bacterium]